MTCAYCGTPCSGDDCGGCRLDDTDAESYIKSVTPTVVGCVRCNNPHPARFGRLCLWCVERADVSAETWRDVLAARKRTRFC